MASKLQNITNEPFDSMDTVDIVSVVAIFLGAAVMSGFATITMAGYDLSAILYTFGTSTEISFALSFILAGGVAAVVTNGVDRENFRDMSDAETIAIAVLAISAVLYVVSPDLASFVQSNVWYQGIYTAISTFAGVVLASE